MSMQNDPDILNVGTGRGAPGNAPLRPSEVGGRVETKVGLGVLGDEEDSLTGQLEMMGKAQESTDKDIVHSLRRNPHLSIGGVEINPVSMETLTMLQEIESPFVTFTPQLTKEERPRMMRLANRHMGVPERGGKVEDIVALTEEEEAELQRLVELAKLENAQFRNGPMEILKFFAIHDPAISDDDRERMVFDDPKMLRKMALASGRRLSLENLEQLGEEIGAAIADAKSTKVKPVSKGKGPSLGNT